MKINELIISYDHLILSVFTLIRSNLIIKKLNNISSFSLIFISVYE